MSDLKVLILGHARHGKDTFAEILRDDHGLSFMSSSQAAADIFIYDALKEEYDYKTPEECFEDRVNHRAEWYNFISEWNWADRTRLAKGILEKSNCYVGMRNKLEVEQCIEEKLFDAIVWVSRSKHLPLEGADSFNIDSSYATHLIDNNGSLEELRAYAAALITKLKKDE